MEKRSAKQIIKEDTIFRSCMNQCLIDGGKNCIEQCVKTAMDTGMTAGDILKEVDSLIEAEFPIDSLVVLGEVLRYEINSRAKPIDITNEYHGEE